MPEVAAPEARPRDRDPAVDHGLLSAHAETIGEGRWALSSYELAFVGLTYGVSDDFQLALTASLPVPPLPFMAGVSAKYVVSRGKSHVAALRGVFGSLTDVWSRSSTTLGFFGAGPMFDVYFDKGQRFAFHGAVVLGGDFAAGFEDDGPSLGKGLLVGIEAGLSLGVGDNIKLLVETQMMVSFAPATGFDTADLALINYGVRLHHGSLAVDLGLVRPFGDLNLEDWVVGYPYLGVTGNL